MNGSERAILRMLQRQGSPQLQQMVAAIMRDREQLEVVLNSLQLGVFVLNTNCQVLFINREGRRLLPLRAGVYRDYPIWNVLADLALADFLREHLPGQLSLEPQERGSSVAGQQRILRLAVGSLVRERKMEGCILTVEDVTAEKYHLLQLRRAEKLASFTNAAAGMAHDIRNPLGAISIHLQLMQRRLRGMEESFVEDLCHYTQVISEEVQRLDQSVQAFLSLTHQSALPLAGLDLRQTVHKVLELLMPELQHHGIGVDLELPEELPLVNGNEQSLQHALVNLLKNAIQAMPSGGTLQIAASSDDRKVYLAIADTGLGIEPQHLERIFEPYYTTKVGGSGLGLTRVCHTIREHQGSIDVSNRSQGGCRVSISLPRAQAHFPLLEEKLHV